MRHFWTTAAAVALCALSSPGWAAPELQYLQLVAVHHHHKAAATHTSSKHKKKTAAKSSRRHSTRSARKAPVLRGAHSSRTSRHHAAPSAIHTEGGGTVKVGRGQTLSQISDKTGVSEAELIRLNHLRKPYRLKAGQRLKLPARRYYVIKSGDTLYSLSRRFGVEQDVLKSLNDIGRRHQIKAGQKLYLPSSAADAEAAAEAARAEREERAAETARQRLESRNVRPRTTAPTFPPPAQPPEVVNPRPSAMPPPAGESRNGFETEPASPSVAPPPTSGRLLPQGSPPPSTADVVAAGRGRFVWPASGALISGFGSKPGGQRNDGVNIAASLGEPVRAAADGEVVYAGDQVPSFGNLVLIKHAGGWVTAYAHMSRITVKNRDQVSQGQEIGVVGQSGSVDRPQLHFEIRYAPSPKDKATPVDPMLLLPGR